MNITIHRFLRTGSALSVGAALWASLGVAPAAAQEERVVTRGEAVAQAREGSPDVLAARARAEAASHSVTAARAFLWPSVGLEAGAVRSDDPVAAFGGRLRQARFTQQDFDPATLNHPDPLTDWSGAVGAAWAPLDLSADAALRAARAEADAAGWGAEWATRAAGFRAEVRYLEAVGARQRVVAAGAALTAAEANLARAESRRVQGVLTDADVLQARAALEGARARDVEARRVMADARERLAVALGWAAGVTPIPADTTLVSRPPGAEEATGEWDGSLDARPDLRASALGVRAAEARVQQVHRARLPTAGGFARLATHAPGAFDRAEDDWTVGFRVRVPVFTGFALSARERGASAMRAAADRDHVMRLRQAQAEVSAARREVEAARQGARAAQAASEAASEAARLMRRRFEEGLTTTADLLGVEAQATALNTQAVNARLGLEMARVRLEFLTMGAGSTDMDERTDQGIDR